MKQKDTFENLRSREKIARKSLIVEAAGRVFAVKPFNEVSIRDIAKEAGISHALIYRYFPDKQSLFVEAYINGAEEIGKIVERVIDKGRKPDIAKVSDAFISYLMDNDQYFRMMTHFMLDGSLSGEELEKLNATERHLFDQFDKLFRKMNKPEPVRLLSHALFAALNGVLITFRNYPGRKPKDVRRHMLHIGRLIAERFSNA